jgi:hypothetical protein
MDERKQDDARQDELQLPADRVEDLEPDAEAADEVKGGLYTWWKKTE